MPDLDPQHPDHEDHAATQRYLDLIDAVHTEWEELEAAGDSSVQLSAGALSTIKESVRADARHGAQVDMPPTPAGPFTMSELSLRTLVRRAVDEVPGATALRTSFDYTETVPSVRSRGLPSRALCRISAHAGTPDLLALADQVRTSVRLTCEADLNLPDLTIDIHIEDLHEH